jgi:hypothetical protein
MQAKKEPLESGSEKFGRGCLKGNFRMREGECLRKCETGNYGCKKRNCSIQSWQCYATRRFFHKINPIKTIYSHVCIKSVAALKCASRATHPFRKHFRFLIASAAADPCGARKTCFNREKRESSGRKGGCHVALQSAAIATTRRYRLS